MLVSSNRPGFEVLTRGQLNVPVHHGQPRQLKKLKKDKSFLWIIVTCYQHMLHNLRVRMYQDHLRAADARYGVQILGLWALSDDHSFWLIF